MSIYFLISPAAAISQGLIIKSGASLVNKSNLILKGNWINEGTFIDTSATVIFSGTSQSIGGTVSSSFNNLTILSGSTTTGSAAGQTVDRILLCNGILNSGGFLTLRSTAKRTALIDGTGTGQVNGNIIMQRYLPSAYGYDYISSPFQASAVNQLEEDIDLSASFPNFYRYDESRTSSGWVTYTNIANILNPLEGYAANFGTSAAPYTFDIEGEVNNGPLSATLYNHNNTYTLGYNLVGNPYPSPIDWDAPAGWTKINIDDALYYFKASTTDEYSGTYSTYINGVSSDPGVATNIIPSMQAFFVHVTDGSFPVTGTLGLTNSVRITDLNHSFVKSSEHVQKPLIRITAKFSDDPLSSDPLVIYFDEKASSGFDSYLDALKLMNTDYFVPNFYSIGTDRKKLSINALPPNPDSICVIPLGLKTNTNAFVIFRIKDLDYELLINRIYITDKSTGIEQDLLNDKEYRVFLNAGEYTDRFLLNFRAATTDIGNVEQDEDIFSVYNSGGVLKAFINTEKTGKGTLSITNLSGQILSVRKIYESGNIDIYPDVKDGIYIVSFKSGKFRSSKKVIIHNK
jgi:hypothetical protein